MKYVNMRDERRLGSLEFPILVNRSGGACGIACVDFLSFYLSQYFHSFQFEKKVINSTEITG
jgi:hypothetical protein